MQTLPISLLSVVIRAFHTLARLPVLAHCDLHMTVNKLQYFIAMLHNTYPPTNKKAELLPALELTLVMDGVLIQRCRSETHFGHGKL